MVNVYCTLHTIYTHGRKYWQSIKFAIFSENHQSPPNLIPCQFFPPYGIFCIQSSLEGEECSVTTWQVHNCVLAKQNHFVVIQKLSMLVIRYVTRITYVDLQNSAIVHHRHQQIAAWSTTDLQYKSTQARIPRKYRKWWKTVYVCSPCDGHKLGAGIPSGGASDV